MSIANSTDISLLDEYFLATLAEQKERELYAKITSLDINELPIDQIEGRVTGGSINIDGTSSVRRTCSLTMISDNIDINDYYWGVKTKFKLEIGVKNDLTGEFAAGPQSIYPEIVWFPQGTFLITNFNTSIATNNCSISLSGKDKMCMLNGDLGGQLFASIDFGTEEYKEKVMKLANIDVDTSEEMMEGQYYKKITPRGDSIDNTGRLYAYATETDYVFLYDDNGDYYKQDTRYYVYQEYLVLSQTEFIDLNFNQIYRKTVDGDTDVTTYTQLTEEQNIEDWLPNTFYKKNETEIHQQRYRGYRLIRHPDDLFINITSDNLGSIDGQRIFQKARISKTSEEQFTTSYYKFYTNAINKILNNEQQLTADNYYVLEQQLYEVEFEYTITKIPISKIIRESVHTYAKEPYHNIIINDVEEYGLEQLTYKGDEPLYVLRSSASDVPAQLFMAKQSHVSLQRILEQSNFQFDALTEAISGSTGTRIGLINLTDSSFWAYKNTEGNWYYFTNDRQTLLTENLPTENNIYTVAKIEYGDDIGYRITDLTYPGDLVSSIGDNLTSILDKIKAMLGNFEYFYDTAGRFIFQRKRSNVNTVWSNIIKDSSSSDVYIDYLHNSKQKFIFTFEGNRLVTAIQNSPVLTNLKNDFVVWGKKKTLTGTEVPIHARYAIDKKPSVYRALNGRIFIADHITDTEKQQILASFADIDLEFVTPQQQSKLIEDIKRFGEAMSEVNTRLPSYLQYAAPQWTGDLEHPFTAGWWNINVWAEFYRLLTGGINPHGSLKFYSTGDLEGCQSQSAIGRNAINGSAWLIQVSRNNENNYSTGHGSGQYNSWSRDCAYYETVVDDYDQAYSTRDPSTPVPVEGSKWYYISSTLGYIAVKLGSNEKRSFPAPYCGCNDEHTYDFFKIYYESMNYDVYFYNPQFPEIKFEGGYSGLIQEAIDNAIEDFVSHNTILYVDWRELIYQMALDYFAAQECDQHPIYDLGNNLVLDNPDHFLSVTRERNLNFYPSGYTGYEQYYTDMQGFWRQLYNPFYAPDIVWTQGGYKIENIYDDNSIYYKKTKTWREAEAVDINIEYYFDKGYASDQKYIIDSNLNPIMHRLEEQIDAEEDLEKKAVLQQELVSYTEIKQKINNRWNLYGNPTGVDAKRKFWNIQVFEDPSQLNFWFDFLDKGTELQQFSVAVVGDRTKVVNEDKAQAIVYKSIPDLIVYNKSGNDDAATLNELNKRKSQPAYTFIGLPRGYEQFFQISYRNTSVKTKIDELLYQYAYCIENVTITALPIYHLEPNTRIYVQDKATNIEGEYLVSKITLPLTYNGTMQITANKAPERLY